MNTVNQPTPEQRQACLLAEYQACQNNTISHASSYWTLAGIFIGISTALLAVVVGGVFANERLFNLLLETSNGASREVLVFAVAVTVFGIAIISILWLLRRWLRRVNFLQQIDWERMREIERDLGMWAHWRVHGIDHWTGKDFDDEIFNADQTRLLAYQSESFWQRWRDDRRYERRGPWTYDWITFALIFLWAFFVLEIWAVALTKPSYVTVGLAIALILAVLVAWLTTHFSSRDS
ncbi:MAG: hypothetical protein HYX84_03250 [Chloroflexi bacterium]|nr:hypothetical protein [Chloroflexota bacterium]